MSAANLQSRFFARMGEPQEFRRLFEHLPGVYFFVKDENSRLIAASRSILERFGLKNESELIGTTDHDYFPPEVADGFIRDDQGVLKSGQPLLNRLEIWYNEQRILDWFITTKLPVHGRDGSIIGLMGITHSYEGRRVSYAPFSNVSKAVEYIRNNFQSKLTNPGLAKAAGLSERQLNRKFHEAFGMTPYEFITRTRIQGASEALARSDAPIVQIAVEFGFCDQSAFTLQFRKHTGITPKQFRRRYHSPA